MVRKQTFASVGSTCSAQSPTISWDTRRRRTEALDFVYRAYATYVGRQSPLDTLEGGDGISLLFRVPELLAKIAHI